MLHANLILVVLLGTLSWAVIWHLRPSVNAYQLVIA